MEYKVIIAALKPNVTDEVVDAVARAVAVHDALQHLAGAAGFGWLCLICAAPVVAGVTVSHGIAMHGQPKYGAGFSSVKTQVPPVHTRPNSPQLAASQSVSAQSVSVSQSLSTLSSQARDSLAGGAPRRWDYTAVAASIRRLARR